MNREFFNNYIQKQIDKDREQSKANDWRFKERTVDCHTIGDFVRAVLAIDNADDAAKFYDGYLNYIEGCPDREQPAEVVAKANIGWCFGEGMPSDQIAMWNAVTGAAHPVFGMTTPSPEEAFNMGVEAVKAGK